MHKAIANIRISEVLGAPPKSIPVNNNVVKSRPGKPQVDVGRMKRLLEGTPKPKP